MSDIVYSDSPDRSELLLLPGIWMMGLDFQVFMGGTNMHDTDLRPDRSMVSCVL